MMERRLQDSLQQQYASSFAKSFLNVLDVFCMSSYVSMCNLVQRLCFSNRSRTAALYLLCPERSTKMIQTSQRGLHIETAVSKSGTV